MLCASQHGHNVNLETRKLVSSDLAVLFEQPLQATITHCYSNYWPVAPTKSHRICQHIVAL